MKGSDLFRFHLKKTGTYKMTYGSIEDGHVHMLEPEEVDRLYKMQQNNRQSRVESDVQGVSQSETQGQ